MEELNYYEGLRTTEDLNKYLELYQRGIKREEASQRIKLLAIEKTRKELYHLIKEKPTKDLCKEFLSEYEKEDELRKYVKTVLIKIELKEKEIQLYQDILQSEGKRQQISCKEYINIYPKGEQISSVRKILSQVQADLKDEEVFIKAKESGELPKLYQYKVNYPNGLHIDKAEDCISFFKIENTNDVNELEDYLKEFSNGINRNKAEERIFFLEAKKQHTIEKYKAYCDEYPEGMYMSEIQGLLKEVVDQKKEQEAFNNAKEEDTIEAFKDYLSIPYTQLKENLEYAKKRKLELVNLKEDNEFFEKVMVENSEEVCVDYIQKFGKQGVHLKEVSQKLSSIQKGENNMNKEQVPRSRVQNSLITLFAILLLAIVYFLWDISSKM